MPPTRFRPFEGLIHRIRRGLAEPIRQLQLSIALLVALVAVGTGGYMLLGDGMTVVEALYMTVITLATVGFKEVRELDETGMLFTVFLIIVGVATFAWAISNAAEVMLGQTFWKSVQRRRNRDMVEELADHYIICGYGRLGRQILRDLRARGEPYVVVDWNAELEEDLLEADIPHIIDDATHERTLALAGIERARGIVAALDSDAQNVLTVLTARELNPRLLIIARAGAENIESKLLRAGADRVVTPSSIGGHRLALALLRPAVHDFFGRIFTLGTEPDVDVGQITVPDDSPFAGQTIAGCDLRRVRNVSILAIRRPEGTFDLNPGAQRRIEPGETLIFIGPAESVYDLEALYSEG
jgi:voltage-gated potassium channel